MAKVFRPYTPKESNLVYEWSKKFFPNALQWRRVRLGSLPTEKNAEMYGILRRWADLLIKYQNTIYIIEAKMRPDPGAIGQLMLYRSLFARTPEFAEFKDLPIKLIFLTTLEDPAVRVQCDEQEIKYEVYAPDWVKTYWATRKGAVTNGTSQST
jgi:hypothetical protein